MPCSPVSVALLSPCDLTDAEWTHLAPLVRLLVNACFYVLRTGCAWRSLPREYPV